MRKLFIGNISWDASEEDLRALFEEYGAVESVKLIVDQYTGRSRGFAFVMMADAQSAKAAIEGLNDKDFKGRQLRVSVAEDKNRSEGGGGGGGPRREGGFRQQGSGAPRKQWREPMHR